MPAGSAAPRPAVAAIGAIGTGSAVASGSADEAIAATPRAARTATRMARRIAARSDGRAAETHDAPDDARTELSRFNRCCRSIAGPSRRTASDCAARTPSLPARSGGRKVPRRPRATKHAGIGRVRARRPCGHRTGAGPSRSRTVERATFGIDAAARALNRPRYRRRTGRIRPRPRAPRGAPRSRGRVREHPPRARGRGCGSPRRAPSRSPP